MLSNTGFSLDELKPIFCSDVLQSAELILDTGEDVSVEHDLFSLRASCVFPSENHHYRPSASYERNSSGTLVMEGHCQCEDHSCVHMAALSMLVHRVLNGSSEPEISGAAWSWIEVLSNNENVSTTETEDLVFDTVEEDCPHRLIYLLSPDHRALHVRVITTYLKQNGAYSQSSNINIGRAAKGGYKHAVRSNDLPILRALFVNSDANLSLHGKAGDGLLLERILNTGRVHLETLDGPALWLGEPKTLSVSWSMDDDGSQRLRFLHDKSDNSFYRQVILDAPFCFDTKSGEVARLVSEYDTATILKIENMPPVAPTDSASLRAAIRANFSRLPFPIPLPAAVRDPEYAPISPTPVLLCSMTRLSDSLSSAYRSQSIPVAHCFFQYGNRRLPSFDQTDPVSYRADNSIALSPRDFPMESRFLDRLGESLVPVEASTFSTPRFFDNHRRYPGCFCFARNPTDTSRLPKLIKSLIPILMDEGWIVEFDQDWDFPSIVEMDPEQEWEIHVKKEGIDWFGIGVDLVVEGEKLPLLPLLVNMLRLNRELTWDAIQELPQNYSFKVPMENGDTLLLPVDKVRTLLLSFIELHDPNVQIDDQGNLAMRYLDAKRISELADTEDMNHLKWFDEEEIIALGTRIKNFTHSSRIPIPPLFHGELRTYQQSGLDWLQFLRALGLGGVLADEMGLGKTVQTLAHLAVEKHSGRQRHPNLVVATTSLVANWKNESARFTPDLKVLVLHGPERFQRFSEIPDADIVLTTYPLLRWDAEALVQEQFHYLILDEAHNIKNPNTVAATTVRDITSQYRLALTGTPMENHLGELWSIMNFLNPGVLGTRKAFNKLFRTPVEVHGDHRRLEFLKKRIAPLMLRRTKQEVADELPDKTYIIKSIELNEGQRNLYESVRLSMHEKVKKEIEEKGFNRSQITILSALMKMRQVCCDPRLLPMKAARSVHESAKLHLLMKLIPEMIEDGRRILLFSQFTQMIRLIEEALQEKHIDYVKLIGNTKNREEPINRFQNQEVPLFLISLKAGGVGLNLTAADTVIHYDPWWNPWVEEQATDRAHRIGQKNPVFVYKLIAEGTIEERMLELQEKKRQLTEGLFVKNGSLKEQFDATDIEILFEPLSQ